MRGSRRTPADLVAVGAAALSVAWLVAAIWAPVALAPLVALAVLATCALAALRRPRSRLYLALGVIGFWLCAGLAGALMLQADSSTGLAWILVVLFATPLPVVPWLYARTFENGDSGIAPSGFDGNGLPEEGRGPRTVDRDSRGQGSPQPPPGAEGRAPTPPTPCSGSSLSALLFPLSPSSPLSPLPSPLSPLSSPLSPVPRPLSPPAEGRTP